MHKAVAEFDWAATTLGPIESWSLSMKAHVRAVLDSRFPIVLHWGPTFIDIFNDAYADLIGEKNLHLGKSVILTNPKWEFLQPLLQGIVDTGDSAWAENRMFEIDRNNYQEESYFTASYSPAYDDDGSVAGVYLTCLEITDQTIQQRRLELLHDIAQVSESTPGLTELVSRVGNAIKQYSLDVPVFLLFLTDDDGELKLAFETQTVPNPDMNIIRKAMEGQAFDLQVPYRNLKAGAFDEVMQQVTIAPLIPPDGSIVGVAIFGVSPSRAYDEKYRDFFGLVRRQLAVAVNNAKQFEEAKSRADTIERIDSVKTGFFNNMSHEMRTPMNAIVGGASLLLEANLPAEQNDLVEMINNSAAHLVGIINDVLDYSKLDSNAVEYASEPFDMSLLIDESIGLIGMQAARTGSSVIRIDQGLIPKFVIGDQMRVRQVFLNLLSNAAKFTELGTIEVRTNYNGTCLQLDISDTGIGIPTDRLDSIFDVFSQVDKRVSTGAGIGLSITRSLVRGMGGSITVESTVGVGTTFHVTLPLAATEQTPAAPVEFKVTKEFAVENPMRILIAEDHPVNQKILAALLDRLGYSTDVVDNGIQAVAAAAKGIYDLVLMDVQMPEMDGLEAAQQIVWAMGDKAPRMIAVTANSKHETDQGASDVGMDGYITKPVTMGALIGALTGVSAKQAVAGSTPAVDASRLMSLVNHASLAGLVQSYLESTAVLLAQAEAAHEEDNDARLAKIMRQVSTSSSAIGADELLGIANRYLDSGEFDIIQTIDAWGRVQRALQRYATQR